MRLYRLTAMIMSSVLFVLADSSCFADTTNSLLINKGGRIDLHVAECDYPPALIPVKTSNWFDSYGGHGWKTGDATWQENCAGYVIRKVWNLPRKYKTSVEPLYTVLMAHGRKVQAPGLPQKGDIIFYGTVPFIDSRGNYIGNNLKHVALVTASAEAAGGYSGKMEKDIPAWVDGKDNDGPYLHYRDGDEVSLRSSPWGTGKEIWRWNGNPPMPPDARLQHASDLLGPCAVAKPKCPPDVSVSCPGWVQPATGQEIQAVRSRVQVSCGPDTEWLQPRIADPDPVNPFFDSDVPRAPTPAGQVITRTFQGKAHCTSQPREVDYSCTQKITIKNETKPKFKDTIPFEVRLNCLKDTARSAADLLRTLKAEDTCGTLVSVNYQDLMPRPPLNKGCSLKVGDKITFMRRLFAKDSAGNEQEAYQAVTVADTTGPTILWSAGIDRKPAQTIREANSIPLPPGPLQAVDDCDTAPRIGYGRDDRGGSGLPGDPKIIQKTIVAKDKCGNDSKKVIQEITLQLRSVNMSVACNAVAGTDAATCTAAVNDRDAVKLLNDVTRNGGTWGFHWYITTAAPGAKPEPQTYTGAVLRIPKPPKGTRVEARLTILSKPANPTSTETAARASADFDYAGAPPPPPPPASAPQPQMREIARAETTILGGSEPAQRPKPKQTRGKEPIRQKYGPFAVPWGSWTSTGVPIKKGESFSAKATGAYQAVNQNTDVKTCGPDGCGHWRWFVLKAKIGNQKKDIGSSGGWTAEQDGVIELGSPRGSEFVKEDAGNCTGSLSVEIWVERRQ